MERTILEGQNFPRCGYCNKETSWILVQFKKRGKKAGAFKKSA